MVEIKLNDEAATIAFAQPFAAFLAPPFVIYLNGDLGAGKTTFARAILRHLGVLGTIKSPTYALVESYKIAAFNLHHFDFYRFNAPVEFEEAGLLEYFLSDSICFVEWAQKAADFVPPADLEFCLTHVPNFPHERLLQIKATSAIGQNCLQKLAQ